MWNALLFTAHAFGDHNYVPVSPVELPDDSVIISRTPADRPAATPPKMSQAMPRYEIPNATLSHFLTREDSHQ